MSEWDLEEVDAAGGVLGILAGDAPHLASYHETPSRIKSLGRA